MPGRTAWRLRATASKSSTCAGNGRGPTRLMSPARTLNSCGSSSREKRRRTRPIRVTRGSSATLNKRPSPMLTSQRWALILSAPGTIERNFHMPNSRLANPTRRWRYRMGPRSPSQIATATSPMTGRVRTSSTVATTMSKLRLAVARKRTSLGAYGALSACAIPCRCSSSSAIIGRSNVLAHEQQADGYQTEGDEQETHESHPREREKRPAVASREQRALRLGNGEVGAHAVLPGDLGTDRVLAGSQIGRHGELALSTGHRLRLGMDAPAQKSPKGADRRQNTTTAVLACHGDATLPLARLRWLVTDDDRRHNDTVERDLHDGARGITAHRQADDLPRDGDRQLEHDHRLGMLGRRRGRAVVEGVRARRGLGPRRIRAEETRQCDERADDGDGTNAYGLRFQGVPSSPCRIHH